MSDSRDSTALAELRFQALAQSSHDLITEIDARGRLLYASPNHQNAAGHREEDLLSGDPTELVHPEDVDLVVQLFSRAFRDEQPERAQFRASNGKGEWRWYECTASPYRTPEGELRILMVARDVNDAKLVEERLRESEERFRLIAENAFDVITEYDEERRLLYANRRSSEIFGYSDSEARAMPPEAIVHPEDRERVVAAMARVSSASGPVLLDHRVRRSDGDWRWIESTSTTYTTSAGQERLLVIARDTTERVESEARLRESTERAQEAQRLESLGMLAGGIAHDFNNLLAVILGNSRFVSRKLPKGHELRSALSDTVDAAESAARLTGQLLTYAGRARAEVRAVDVSAVPQSMGGLLEAAVPANVTLELDLASGLPFTLADAVQLEQVVMNLVINGAEAIGSDPGTLRVKTGRVDVDEAAAACWIGAEACAAGDYIYVEVSDTGAGMDPATRLRIFDPFFTTKATGHGLGLATVLGLVRQHGGGVTVETEPGRGTAIRVHLPTCAEPTEDAEGATDAEDRFGVTVLVTDDEAAIRRLTRRVLEEEGCRVLEAADGMEALRTFEEHADEIDLVVLDIQMPQAGGADVLTRIRELRPDVPVLLISGYEDAAAAHKVSLDESTWFLPKPFDGMSLLKTARRLVGKSRDAPDAGADRLD